MTILDYLVGCEKIHYLEEDSITVGWGKVIHFSIKKKSSKLIFESWLSFCETFYWSIVAFNVVLFSPVQQSESAICIHISPLFWISCPFSHRRALSRVPCGIQYVLFSYLFYVVVVEWISHVWLLETPWTVACQAPQSMRFFRQEYWSGLPCFPPVDLPDPGIEPVSLALAGRFFTTSTTWEAP